MNREQFIRENEPAWLELETMLTAFEKRKPPADADELPRLYRQVCRDLSIAQHRMYGIAIIDRLNRLVIRGYKQVYKSRGATLDVMVRFFTADFPQVVRQEWRLFWLNMACYWLPFFAMMFAAYHEPSWIHAFLGPEQMVGVDQSYGQGGNLTREGFGEDLEMFGFYIFNNIGIDFKTFVSGIAFGVGTLFFMFFNGIAHGAVAGYIHMQGYFESFYGFVSGHSAFELLAMILSGVAGMKLGLAILRPGRYTRGEALRRATAVAIKLLIGAAVMTFIAAGIEGFWSASPVPPPVKYVVGIGLWVLLSIYFLFGGRARET